MFSKHHAAVRLGSREKLVCHFSSKHDPPCSLKAEFHFTFSVLFLAGHFLAIFPDVIAFDTILHSTGPLSRHRVRYKTGHKQLKMPAALY